MTPGATLAAWATALAAPMLAALAIGATQPVTASPAPALRKAPDGRPLQLTFTDEFDRFRPLHAPGGVWRTTFGDGRVDDLDQRTIRPNGELQLYLDARMSHRGAPVGLDPFTVRDGVLEIAATKLPEVTRARLDGYAYGSGLITSQPSFSQKYGYFEMRASLPQGKGLWPAFWLLPIDLSWPPEIDVMESVGDPSRVYVTSHSKTRQSKGIEARIAPRGFHTFAVAWDAKDLVWYVDGKEVGRQPTPDDMHKPMFLLANLAIGGGWAGAPDETTRWPAKFRIDYIRAYRFSS